MDCCLAGIGPSARCPGAEFLKPSLTYACWPFNALWTDGQMTRLAEESDIVTTIVSPPGQGSFDLLDYSMSFMSLYTVRRSCANTLTSGYTPQESPAYVFITSS